MQFFGPNDSRLSIDGCTESAAAATGSTSSCAKLFDGVREPLSDLVTASYAERSSSDHAWLARGYGGGRVSIDLGPPPKSGHLIVRIVIWMTPTMRDGIANDSSLEGGNTVSVFLGATANST